MTQTTKEWWQVVVAVEEKGQGIQWLRGKAALFKSDPTLSIMVVFLRVIKGGGGLGENDEIKV